MNNPEERNQSDADPASVRGEGKRSSGYRNEVAVGLAVILTVLVVYFGVRFMEGEHLFRGTYDLFAELETAGGLTRGSSVRISGIKIGEVADVRLGESSRGATVRMEIRDDIAVPEGSKLSITGISALDNVDVEIEPAPDGDALHEDGDTLRTRRQADLMGQVDSTIADAQRTFRQAESLVATTEHDLGIVLTELQTAGSEASLLMQDSRDRIRSTLEQLQSAATDLNRFADQMDSVALNLNRVTGPGGDTLVAAVNRLSEMVERLDGVVFSLERGSASLESVASRMNSGDGTFNRLVSDPSLYDRLDSAAMNLNEILSEFRTDPKKYLRHLDLIDVF